MIIDMWEMADDKHVFGWWKNDNEPYAFAMGKVAAPIRPNMVLSFTLIQYPEGRNYLGNPNPSEFGGFLGHCKTRPALFTMKGYQMYLKQVRR